MKNNKRYTFILFFLLTSYLSSYAQRQPILLTAEQKALQRQNWEQRGDSAVSSRVIVRMKHVFTVDPKQEQTLFLTGININQRRRQVLKTYDRSSELQLQLVKVNQSADSLYRSIVGEINYQLFKDAMRNPLHKRQPLKVTDSLQPKNQQP
jgi:hypothetical protein